LLNETTFSKPALFPPSSKSMTPTQFGTVYGSNLYIIIRT
jgi:hypothetical protein